MMKRTRKPATKATSWQMIDRHPTAAIMIALLLAFFLTLPFPAKSDASRLMPPGPVGDFEPGAGASLGRSITGDLNGALDFAFRLGLDDPADAGPDIAAAAPSAPAAAAPAAPAAPEGWDVPDAGANVGPESHGGPSQP